MIGKEKKRLLKKSDVELAGLLQQVAPGRISELRGKTHEEIVDLIAFEQAGKRMYK